MGGRESATLEKNYDNRSRMAHRGMHYHACYRARHPFERTPSMTKKKRGDAAVEDEQSSLIQSSASGDGLDEEMQEIMRILGISMRPSYEMVMLPVANLVIPRARLSTVTQEARRIARSIPVAGIKDPIAAVMISGDSHLDPQARILVLDGRRRSIAAQMGELEQIPGCLYDAQATPSQLQALIIAIGNLQRRDEWRREVEALNQLVRGEKEIFKGDQVRLTQAGLEAYGKERRGMVFAVEDDPLLHASYDQGALGDRYRLGGLPALVYPHEIAKVGRGLTEEQLLYLGFAPETLRTRLAMAFLPDPIVELIVGGKMSETVARWMVGFRPSVIEHFAELARTGQSITAEAVKRARTKQITPQPLLGVDWAEAQTSPALARSPMLPSTALGGAMPYPGAGSLAEQLTLLHASIQAIAAHLDPNATPETEQILFMFSTLSPLLQIVARQCNSVDAANTKDAGPKEGHHDD